AEVIAPLAPYLPPPTWVLVCEGIGVLDRQGRLSHAAQAMNRGQHAHLAQPDRLPQPAQLGGAAHEVLIVPVHIPLGLEHLADPPEPVMDLAVELVHPRPDGGVLECLGPLVEPRAEVDVLAAA